MLINAILFNIMWFGCIYLGNMFSPVVFAWAIFHLSRRQSVYLESIFIILVTTTGIIIDSTLMYIGILNFSEVTYLIPFWLIMIWLSFSLTINVSLRYLQPSPIQQFLVGAIFPPISYLAGESMGVVTFGYSSLITFFMLSVLWGCLFMIFFTLNNCLGVYKYDEQTITNH